MRGKPQLAKLWFQVYIHAILVNNSCKLASATWVRNTDYRYDKRGADPETDTDSGRADDDNKAESDFGRLQQILG